MPRYWPVAFRGSKLLSIFMITASAAGLQPYFWDSALIVLITSALLRPCGMAAAQGSLYVVPGNWSYVRPLSKAPPIRFYIPERQPVL